MFFNDFIREVGPVDLSLVEPVKQLMLRRDLDDQAYSRREDPLVQGRLVLAMHHFEPSDLEAYDLVKPLIEAAQQHYPDTIPYRVELSMLKPGKSVHWHYDGRVFHQLCYRVHIPIIPSLGVLNLSRWWTEKQLYTYKIREGFMTELNNRVPHAITHLQLHDAVDRTHLVIDLIKAEFKGMNHDDLNKRERKRDTFEFDIFSPNAMKIHDPLLIAISKMLVLPGTKF